MQLWTMVAFWIYLNKLPYEWSQMNKKFECSHGIWTSFICNHQLSICTHLLSVLFKKFHFAHGTRYRLGNFQNTIFNRKPCYCQDNFQNTISDRKLERFQSRLWRMCVYQNHLISCGKIDLITIHVQFCYMIPLVMCVLFRTKPV